MIIPRPLAYLLVAVACNTFPLLASAGGPHQPWVGGILPQFAHDGPSVTLMELRQDELHLIGTFYFENISGPRQSARNVILEGVEREVGQFWPRVRLEARRKDKSSWESLGTSSIIGKSATLMVKAESPLVKLCVRLDVFQTVIGKYSWGRIVLSSGETGEFALSDIAPPPAAQQ